jgi:hypothetical protein
MENVTEKSIVRMMSTTSTVILSSIKVTGLGLSSIYSSLNRLIIGGHCHWSPLQPRYWGARHLRLIGIDTHDSLRKLPSPLPLPLRFCLAISAMW